MPFTFGSQTVDATPARLVFDSHRSYTDVAIDVPGVVYGLSG